MIGGILYPPSEKQGRAKILLLGSNGTKDPSKNKNFEKTFRFSKGPYVVFRWRIPPTFILNRVSNKIPFQFSNTSGISIPSSFDRFFIQRLYKSWCCSLKWSTRWLKYFSFFLCFPHDRQIAYVQSSSPTSKNSWSTT